MDAESESIESPRAQLAPAQYLAQHNLGKDFSFSALLHPLPAAAFGAVAEVCGLVPVSLAPPFLEACLRRDYRVEVDGNTVANVLWKLKTYLPSALGNRFSLNAARLKELQALAPDHNTVHIGSVRRHCPCGKQLEYCAPKDRSNVANNIKKNASGAVVVANRYRVITFGAGVQYATFQAGCLNLTL